MTINISFNSGLYNVDSFEINGNTEYGSYASFETEDSTFTLGNISCNGDIAESLTITDPNYSSYSDSIFSQYDTFTINTIDGNYTIDVDSVFTSVFTVTASANDCDLGDVYVDDVSNRACSISEDITPYADYTLGSVSKIYCKFLNWSDGDKNPIRQMTAGAGGNTSNYNASFTYKFVGNWYKATTANQYIVFDSSTNARVGNGTTMGISQTYTVNLTTGLVTLMAGSEFIYDNTNDLFTTPNNLTYTKVTNPQLKTLHIDLHDSGGGIGTSGSVGVVNVTTPEDGTVQMYVVYGYDCKRSDYDFKIAPGQSITFTKVFPLASGSITFTKEQGTCTYTSTLLSDGLRIDFSDISTDCELRVVLPVNNQAYQNGDYLLDCDLNEEAVWDSGWNLTVAPLLGHGTITSQNYNLGNRGCNSSVGGMMYYCIEPKPVTTYTVTVITDPDVMTATGGGTYNSGASCTLTATVIDPMYEFEDWNDGSSVLSTSNPYTFTVTGNITVYGRHREVQPPQPSSAILTVTTNDCTLGEVCIGSGNYGCSDSRTVYDYENPVEIYAQAVDPDAFFDGWYVDGTYESDDNPYEAAVYEDRTYQAHFTQVAPPPTEYYTISGSISGQGTISGTGTYMEGDNVTLTATPASGWEFERWFDTDNREDYYDNPLTIEGLNRDWDIVAIFAENIPPVVTYTVTVNVTGQGTTTGAGDYEEGEQVTLTAAPSTGYEFSSWQINGTVVETNSTYQFIMGNQDVTITAVFEEEAEKHIYLCDNSGAHLVEMTKTGSTWSVTGAFTSGMYSIRATVENEYEDAWFKFYQTSGDNRVFVGAGDDPEFTDIGTYIMIDDILTSFSLTEDQTTGYYVVNYQNTDAMTTSMVDTIVNSYIGGLNIPTDTSDLTNGAGFITVSDVSSMSYITMTDIEACGYIDQTALSSMSYITMTDVSSLGYLTQSDISNMSYITISDVQSLGYIDQTALSNMSYVDTTALSNMSYVDQTTLSSMGYMTATDISSMGYTTVADISSMSYVDQTSLSNMSYVNNSYLSTYMNNVVGDINAILQTI